MIRLVIIVCERTRACGAVCTQMSLLTQALFAARDEKRTALRTVNRHMREISTLREKIDSTEKILRQMQVEKDSAIADSRDAHARADTLAARLASALDKCDDLENRLAQACHSRLELLSKLDADANLRAAAVLRLTRAEADVPEIPTPISDDIESRPVTDILDPLVTAGQKDASDPNPASDLRDSNATSVVDTTCPAPSTSVAEVSDEAHASATTSNSQVDDVSFAETEITGAENTDVDGILSLRPNLSPTSSSSTLSTPEVEKGAVKSPEGKSSNVSETDDRTGIRMRIGREISEDGSEPENSNKLESTRSLQLYRAPWVDSVRPDLQIGNSSGLRALYTDECPYSSNLSLGVAFATGLRHRSG